MFTWAWDAFRPLLWVGVGLIGLVAGLGWFFFFDLVALKDPQALTLSQQLREFNTWSPSSYLLTIGLPGLFYAWYCWHILDLNSP